MPMITAGAVATTLGVIWKFWRVPVRFYQWYKAEEVEPAVGQRWRETGFSGPHIDWKIIDLKEEPWHIFLQSTTKKDSFDDLEETNMDLEQWENAYIKKRRLFCKDAGNSMEDLYWGEHSED